MAARRSRATPFAASGVSRSGSTESFNVIQVPDDLLESDNLEVRGHEVYNTRTSNLATPENVADLLATRYEQNDLPYTFVGPRILLSIDNDTTRDNNKIKETSKQYSASFNSNVLSKLPSFDKNIETSSVPLETLPAHSFTLIERAYHHMLSNKDDQCVIFLGDAGSGKSSQYKMLLRHLADISRSGDKKSKIEAQILKLPQILSSFGNATTPYSQNASCFTNYSEVQFDSNGDMVGIKIIDYLLDKSRIAAGSTDGGRNMHVFYQLLAGATPEEKVQLYLSDAAHFSYLKSTIQGESANVAQVNSTQAGGLLTAGNYSTVAEDAISFNDLRDNLKTLGIGRRLQSQIWQVLAAILHLGNITFTENSEGETCTVQNQNQLELVASLLGVDSLHLQNVLVYRQQTIGKDLTSIILTVPGACRQRDSFAKSLYSVLFSWLLERINDTLCLDESSWTNYIALLDTPGFFGRNTIDNGFHRLLLNYQQERLYYLVGEQMFNFPSVAFENEGIDFDNELLNMTNKDIVSLLSSPKNGIITTVDREASRGTRDSKINSKINDFAGTNNYFINSEDESKKIIKERSSKYSFGIKHTSGDIFYSSKGFSDYDTDILQSDFVTLIRGSPELSGTSNAFLRNVFSDSVVATKFAQTDGQTLVAAKSLNRRPSSIRRRKTNDLGRKNSTLHASDETKFQDTVGNQFITNFNDLISVLNETQTWFVFCIKSSAMSQNGRVSVSRRMQMLDKYLLTRQVEIIGILKYMCSKATSFTSAFAIKDFLDNIIANIGVEVPAKISSLNEAKDLIKEALSDRFDFTKDVVIGKSRVFTSERAWSILDLESAGKRLRKSESTLIPPTNQLQVDDTSDERSEKQFEINISNLMGDEKDLDLIKANPKLYSSDAAENSMVDLFKPEVEKKRKKRGFFSKKDKSAEEEKPPKKPLSRKRCQWLTIVWFFTWFIPGFMLGWCGMKKNSGRRIAWREKFTLCVLILLMNALVLFVIIGIGLIICPVKDELSPGEISARSTANSKALVFMYGNYYDVNGIWKNHADEGYAPGSTGFWENEVLGKDVSQMFPKDNAWSSYCPGFQKPAVFSTTPDDIMNNNLITGQWVLHNTSDIQQLRTKIKGDVVWDQDTLVQYTDAGRRFIKMYDRIYDVTPFFAGIYSQTKDNFFGDTVKTIFTQYASDMDIGNDATDIMNRYRAADPQAWNNVMTCMQGMFYAGRVDHRKDTKCVATNYILLAASIVVVMVIGIKFLAALQFGGKKQPEEYEKFVILQVPCYTEDEKSLRRTIDTLSLLEYEDSHKLLLIICDGMIVGSGNEKPTPRMVLDILGVPDDGDDPDKVAFRSVGDDNLQLNYGRVYSGLYEIQGKTVPYLVVVKVGKETERHRPGNRGKRDSQLILMHFLNKVFYNLTMTPLECEIYHQIKNVIGVDPSYYEFVLMVDADTEVLPDSLNRLVSTMVRDGKISGLCGETLVSNEKESWVTMIQVYEYFISHHMAKAFESIFGTVTCLPGCFCMYRIRGLVDGKNSPILVHKNLVKDYSENTVDTLHLKNLLHLGEDRYLTTLVLKHFPHMKTAFTSDAKAKTNAPNSWKVLLSQRRRWINSTVHNLFELLYLNELCGFLCFSMRFVVFLDIMATFVQPAALGYIIFLIIYASTTDMTVPTISIILIAAIYGLQIIIFILKRQWQHIGWMFFYILAIPIFGCIIPAYSFWHFDDFSWGNTRKLEGEELKKSKAKAEKFDESSIPLVEYKSFEPERLQKECEYQLALTKKKQQDFINANEQIDDAVYASSAIEQEKLFDPIYGYTGNSFHDTFNNARTDNRVHDYVQQQSMMVENTFPSDVQISQEVTHEAFSSSPIIADGPSNATILARIKEILTTADLMTVTKKSVREQLSRENGIDMTPYKDFINQCIDDILRGDL